MKDDDTAWISVTAPYQEHDDQEIHLTQGGLDTLIEGLMLLKSGLTETAVSMFTPDGEGFYMTLKLHESFEDVPEQEYTQQYVLPLYSIYERAYLAGFSASGEGYNAEYPFADKGTSPVLDKDWVKARDAAILQIRKEIGLLL
jgi:hypothetical protein